MSSRPRHPDPGTGPVAVLVVTWNSARVLPAFLASLPEGMAGLDWRLVVADNVLSHVEPLGAYSAARQADPTLSSVTVPLDRGLELSVVLAERA